MHPLQTLPLQVPQNVYFLVNLNVYCVTRLPEPSAALSLRFTNLTPTTTPPGFNLTMDTDWGGDFPSNLYLYELAPIYPAVIRKTQLVPMTKRSGTIAFIASNCDTEAHRDTFAQMLMYALNTTVPPIQVRGLPRGLPRGLAT